MHQSNTTGYTFLFSNKATSTIQKPRTQRNMVCWLHSSRQTWIIRLFDAAEVFGQIESSLWTNIEFNGVSTEMCDTEGKISGWKSCISQTFFIYRTSWFQRQKANFVSCFITVLLVLFQLASILFSTVWSISWHLLTVFSTLLIHCLSIFSPADLPWLLNKSKAFPIWLLTYLFKITGKWLAFH